MTRLAAHIPTRRAIPLLPEGGRGIGGSGGGPVAPSFLLLQEDGSGILTEAGAQIAVQTALGVSQKISAAPALSLAAVADGLTVVSGGTTYKVTLQQLFNSIASLNAISPVAPVDETVLTDSDGGGAKSINSLEARDFIAQAQLLAAFSGKWGGFQGPTVGTTNPHGNGVAWYGAATSPQSASSTDPMHSLNQTNTSAGNQVSQYTEPLFYAGRNPRMSIRFRIRNVASTSSRIFLGFADIANTAIDDSNAPVGNLFGLHFDVLRGDVNWQLMSSDNAVNSITDTGIPVNKTTWGEFMIQYTGSAVQLYIDGFLQASKATNLPLTSSILRAMWSVTTVNAATSGTEPGLLWTSIWTDVNSGVPFTLP